MSEVEYKTQGHLIHTISETYERSRYAFFLGAGCSFSSGIRTTSELIKEWRGRLFYIENFNDFPQNLPKKLCFELSVCISCMK